MTDYEQTWKEFWEPIIAPNGEIDVEQLKKELFDFSTLMKSASEVYEHVAGLSKCNTDPKYIIDAFEERINEAYEEGRGDGFTDGFSTTVSE